MDDFERRKKSLVVTEKYLISILKKNRKSVLNDTLSKASQYIFAYSYVSEHSSIFFIS